MCKRYKLEDQLSDIQFIDCSTPEHTIANHPASANTIYTSVQVHNPPASNRSSIISCSTGEAAAAAVATTNSSSSSSSRYSYPVTKFRTTTVTTAATIADDTTEPKRYKEAAEQRFSYPGIGAKFTTVDDAANSSNGQNAAAAAAVTLSSPIANKPIGILRRSSSSEWSRNAELDRSKLSLATTATTPTTPGHSPRYSLLIGGGGGGGDRGSGSSANSSLLSTPVFEMDMSGNSAAMLQLLPPNEPLDQSHQSRSCGRLPDHSFEMLQQTNTKEPQMRSARDIATIKVEMSLDLVVAGSSSSKMSIDGDASQSSSVHQHANRQVINIPSTPNTPNYTTTQTSGNTSQSMTPSEFGYQHLNHRQSGAVSLENSPTKTMSSYDRNSSNNPYGALEESFSQYDAAAAAAAVSHQRTVAKKSSPIRSTINITYNLKSPRTSTTPTHENLFFTGAGHKMSGSGDYEVINVVRTTVQPNVVVIDVGGGGGGGGVGSVAEKKPLLETSFDENMVYEQVKCFKGAISEVNSLMLVNNGNGGERHHKNMDDDIHHHVPQIVDMMTNSGYERQPLLSTVDDDNDDIIDRNYENVERPPAADEVNRNDDRSQSELLLDNNSPCDDVPMYENDQIENINQDSLELDSSSLYENVELRRPDCVYENVDVQSKQFASAAPPPKQTTPLLPLREQKQTNFTVRQLANKFETSPIETPPPFDFSKGTTKSSHQKQLLDNNRNSPSCVTKAKNSKQPLHKSAKITRSLDENAFIREFGNGTNKAGGGPKLEIITHKSSQQISGDETTTDGRRMSLEFTRPKSLNPPKRLPLLECGGGGGGDIADSRLCKIEAASKLTLDLRHKAMPTSTDGELVVPPKYDDVKITPTTENPISLIQHNVAECEKSLLFTAAAAAAAIGEHDDKSSSIKVLNNCKLDRDRIEKIKEERRHQLNEKFRSESFRAAAAAAAATGATTDAIKMKSKSKIELRDDGDGGQQAHHHKAESLRYKSKSRGDIRYSTATAETRLLTKDELLDSSSSSSRHSNAFGTNGRIRRISDEKNQNDCLDYDAVASVVSDLATAKVMRNKTEPISEFIGSIGGGGGGAGRDRDNISASAAAGATASNTTRNSMKLQ